MYAKIAIRRLIMKPLHETQRILVQMVDFITGRRNVELRKFRNQELDDKIFFLVEKIRIYNNRCK
jgi:hypothetical protein